MAGYSLAAAVGTGTYRSDSDFFGAAGLLEVASMKTLIHLCCAAAMVLASQLRAEESAPAVTLPDWLQEKITGFDALPEDHAPLAVWQITHKGLPAYFLISPCCDQYNPLFDAQGKTLCYPSGGIVGRGDGQCPYPADRGRPILLLWQHSHSSVKNLSPPRLAKP